MDFTGTTRFDLFELFRRHFVLFLAGICLLLAFNLVQVPDAHAQALGDLTGTGTTAKEEEDALNRVIEDARSNGAKIIVIEPQTSASPPDEEQMTMVSVFSGRSLLKARWQLVKMLDQTALFYRELPHRMKSMGTDGTIWWVFRALLTATAGLLFGKYIFMLVTRWGRKNLGNTTSLNLNSKRLSNKLGLILFRAGWMTLSSIVAFVAAVAVAVVFDSGHDPTRDFIWEIITTYTVYRFVRSVVFWNFFAPSFPHQRLINLPDDRANKIFNNWAMLLIIVAIMIGFVRFLDELSVSEISTVVIDAAIRITAIGCAALATLLLAALTIYHRKDTHMMVLGQGDPEQKTRIRKLLSLLVTPLLLLYAVFAFVAGSLRLILGQEGGMIVLAAPIIVFIAAIFVYGLGIFLIERIYETLELNYYRRRKNRALAEARTKRREAEARRVAQGMDDEDMRLAEYEEMEVRQSSSSTLRHKKYFPAFKPFFTGVLQAVVITVSIGETFRLWGYDLGREGGHPIAIALDTLLVLVIAWGAFRAFNRFIDQKIIEEGGTLDSDEVNPGEGDGEGGKGQSRLATLLPIFRNLLVFVISIVVFITVLSSLGVDVGPLFAGAGVVGIAIGFGAQTLIRDIFSGAFFLLDDAFRKGEYIEIDQTRGIVERISIRSFQLRHHLGAVHTIPFGEIKRITNFSRDWVMMKLPLRLTYDTDVDRVRKLVKKLGQELLKDPDIGKLFLQPLKSQGVYSMEDSAMIIRVKFMTRPGDQFITRKAVYAAIRELFEREGIRFAHREVTVRLAENDAERKLSEGEKKTVTGAVRDAIEDEAGSAPAKAASYDDL